MGQALCIKERREERESLCTRRVTQVRGNHQIPVVEARVLNFDVAFRGLLIWKPEKCILFGRIDQMISIIPDIVDRVTQDKR